MHSNQLSHHKPKSTHPHLFRNVYTRIQGSSTIILPPMIPLQNRTVKAQTKQRDTANKAPNQSPDAYIFKLTTMFSNTKILHIQKHLCFSSQVWHTHFHLKYKCVKQAQKICSPTKHMQTTAEKKDITTGLSVTRAQKYCVPLALPQLAVTVPAAVVGQWALSGVCTENYQQHTSFQFVPASKFCRN